jgi:DNA-binding transcriptional LysR family regulator
MDLRQLRYFTAVAEELHFGRAAQRVGIAQPPLTQQIQKLERELGCQLLERGRKTTLTPAGSALLDRARRLLEDAGLAADAARRASRGETGELTIGAPPSLMLSSLPEVIGRYRRQFPRVRLTLKERATSAIEEAVRGGEIDLGFLRETTPDPPLQFERVLEERVVAVLPARHRLARTREVKAESLSGEPFVFFPRRLGPVFYDRLVAFCSQAGFAPRVAQEAAQWPSIVCLVAAGMGVSLAPGCLERFRRTGVVYRPVKGLTTRVLACWNAEKPSATVAPFLKMAREGLR